MLKSNFKILHMKRNRYDLGKTIEADVWMTQMLNLIYKKDSKEPTVNMFLALK